MAGVSAPASAGRIGRDTTVEPRLAEPVASAREEAACELSAGLDRSVRFCFMGGCNLQYTSGRLDVPYARGITWPRARRCSGRLFKSSIFLTLTRRLPSVPPIATSHLFVSI